MPDATDNKETLLEGLSFSTLEATKKTKKRLEKERKSYQQQIEYYTNILNDDILPDLKNSILKLEQKISAKNIEISELQQSILYNSSDYSNVELILKKEELSKLCDELLSLETELKKEQENYNYQKQKLSELSFDEIKDKINSLNEKLNKNTEQLTFIRNKMRLLQLDEPEEVKQNKIQLSEIDLEKVNLDNFDLNSILPESDLEFLNKTWYEEWDNKIYIDENLGIYILYDKPGVIGTTMKCFFGAGDIPTQTIESMSNPALGGLAGILDMFIETLIKAIGQFAKQFFFFKNTIDLLAGLELGELLGNAIPGIVKVLQELKLMLTDTPKWMLKTLLGPLFDTNVPIPKFCINIGDFIPFLPFNLCIPEIDPFGYFSKNTALNLNADPRDVPITWLADIQTEVLEMKKEEKVSALENRIKKLKILNDKIKELENRINRINIYDKQVTICLNKLKQLELKEKSCHDTGCTQEIIDLTCSEIDKQKKCLNDLLGKQKVEQHIIDIMHCDIQSKDSFVMIPIFCQSLIDAKKELEILKKDKEILNKNEIKSKFDYKKRSIIVAMNENIENDGLADKLEELYDLGVNVYDNTNLELLQKIGHDFTSDDYLKKLIDLRSEKISLSNNKQLRFLYDLGFSFNDPNHISKIHQLSKYISLDSTQLILLVDMGLNLQNENVFDVLKELKSLNIKLTKTILVRLETIGFNFNNPHSIENLKILGDYIDLGDVKAYETAIQRNISLNNPYFKDILIKTHKIGLRWGGSDSNGYFNVEDEIISDTSIPTNVDYIIKILDYFKMSDNNYIAQKYYRDIYSEAKVKNELSIYDDITYIETLNYTTQYSDGETEINRIDAIYTLHTSGDYHGAEIEIYIDNVLTDTITSSSSIITDYSYTIPYNKEFKLIWHSGSDDTESELNVNVNKNGNNITIYDFSTFGIPNDNDDFLIDQQTITEVLYENEWYDTNNDLHEDGRVYTSFYAEIPASYKMELTGNFHGAEINVYIDDILQGSYTNSTTNTSVIEFDVPYGLTLKLTYSNAVSQTLSEASYNLLYKDNIIDTYNSFLGTNLLTTDTRNEKKLTLNYAIKSLNLSHFYDKINQYSKYDIILNIPKLNDIKPYEEPYNIKTPNKLLFIDNINGFIEKLLLLKEFHEYKGWKIGDTGEISNEQLGGNYIDNDWNNINDDFDILTQGSGLNATKEINTTEHQISFDVLRGVYNELEKLGLNIKDPNFKTNFDYFFNNLGISMDESVLLDTTRVVTLTYTDIKRWEWNDLVPYHPVVTIDLSTNKVDPDVYSNARYNATISVTEVKKENVSKQPMKSVVQFNVLQKLGFNFKQPNALTFLNKLVGLNLDLKKHETKLTIDALISIGWHLTNDTNYNKLQYLIDNGLNFKILEEPDTIVTTPVSQMYSKLEHLSLFGFNFQKNNYQEVFSILNSLNIKLKNTNFEAVIENLIGFGINLNDDDWYSKLNILINEKFDFTPGDDINIIDDWRLRLDNLSLMGIDFNGYDWYANYQKMKSFKQFGLNYTDITLRKKITILTNLGLDFSKPEDEWKQKVESLIKLKLIKIPSNIISNKKDYLSKLREDKLTINKELIKYQRLNNDPTYIIDDEISKIKIKIKHLDSQINIEENYKKRDKLCVLFDNDKRVLTELLLKKESIIKLQPNYDKEIENLTTQKENLINQVYKLNEKIIFESLDKFKGFETSGLNFYDKNYQKNIDNVIDSGFNFGLVDWEDKLKLITKLFPVNPILEWIKSLVEMIKTIIMMPVQMLMGIIKMLIDLIKQVIGIPLNPVKIPDWSKGILDKFKALIDLIMSLTTIEGIMDILFMSPDGLKLIDVFIPGFASFMSMLMKKVTSWKDDYKDSIKALSDKKSQLKNLKIDKNILNNKLSLFIDQLNNSSTSTDNVEKNIELQKKILLENNETLKKLLDSDVSISKQTLLNIQKELEKNCDSIDEVDNMLNEANNLSTQQLNNNITNLDKNKDNLEIQIKKLSNDINKLNIQKNELKDKASLGDLCSWTENVDVLILKVLKDFVMEMRNKPNPYDERLQKNQQSIDNINKALTIAQTKKDSLEKYINGNSLSNQQVKNNKAIVVLNAKIDSIDKYACSNELSDSELDKLSTIKNDLLRERNELIDTDIDPNVIGELNTLINNLKEKLRKLKIEKKELENKSKKKQDEINASIEQLDDIAKWFVVILNIICCTPKLVVNIIIVILNAVGYMKNLPTLWEFPYIN